MTPSVILSLAAAMPAWPSAREETIHGKEIAAPAANDCFKTSRRVGTRLPLLSIFKKRSSREVTL